MEKKSILLMLSAVFLNAAGTQCHAESDRSVKNCPVALNAADLEKISIPGAHNHPYPIGTLVSITRTDLVAKTTTPVGFQKGMALAKSYAVKENLAKTSSHGERNCAYTFFTRNSFVPKGQAGVEKKTDRLVIEFSPISYAKLEVKPQQAAESGSRRPAPARRGKTGHSIPATEAHQFPPPPADMAPSRPRPQLPIPMQHDPRIVPPAPLLPPR